MGRKKNGLVEGWGINDVDYDVTRSEVVNGKKKTVWTCPYYRDWKRVLRFCLNPLVKRNKHTYKHCTVCEEWKYLSNFIKWVDSQPNKDWENCSLDKDFLVKGNKHYSPSTCVYIDSSLNNFLTDCRKSRGNYLIGVSKEKKNKVNPYKASCRNPLDKSHKARYIGVFPSEELAHKAWQTRKHEIACQLADLQTDKRISKVLREMYSPDKDWTKD